MICFYSNTAEIKKQAFNRCTQIHKNLFRLPLINLEDKKLYEALVKFVKEKKVTFQWVELNESWEIVKYMNCLAPRLIFFKDTQSILLFCNCDELKDDVYVNNLFDIKALVDEVIDTWKFDSFKTMSNEGDSFERPIKSMLISWLNKDNCKKRKL